MYSDKRPACGSLACLSPVRATAPLAPQGQVANGQSPGAGDPRQLIASVPWGQPLPLQDLICAPGLELPSAHCSELPGEQLRVLACAGPGKHTEWCGFKITLGQVCSPQFTNCGGDQQPVEYDRILSQIRAS